MKVCVPIAKCYEANVRSLHIYIYIYCFTHFYIQQDNTEKLTKKTHKNKQQYKDKTLVTKSR